MHGRTLELKEGNPSERNCQNQLSHPTLSHIEQERQGSLINIQQNLKEDLE